eukprot:TRINITY_DN7587_c0_g1_i1.p1 TRINITY_DN7587_c0_g1~~TRINITY_DN7587_c0_g1_i1.p1  ORF type:complete len:399 (-),score=94.37 TRINITY_DN7587_c0_g1_i1:449-1645(-)
MFSRLRVIGSSHQWCCSISTKPLRVNQQDIINRVKIKSEDIEKKRSRNKITAKPAVNSIFTDEEPISSVSESDYDPVTLAGPKASSPLILQPRENPPLSQLPSLYSQLSKSRLTLLVCITSSTGYVLAPGAFEPLAFASVCLGTWALSCSANTLNQIMEVPYDSQMNRTKNRVLVRGLISPLHASGFALSMAGFGGATLLFGANGIAALLGLSTWALYFTIYTTLKRSTIYNTWIGSIVGAIPPLIGWAGSAGTLSLSALIPAAILYSWQFPHFNALSWNLRPDYSRAGYRMMSVLDPDLCLRVALRHSLGLIGICSAAPFLGLTDWTFALDSLPLNVYLSVLAYQFYKKEDSSSSRKLFHYTLIHLPLLLTLLVLGNKSKGYSERKTKETNDSCTVV